MFNILGVDISNNNSITDLSTLKNNGVQYVYLKATEGTTFKDKTSPARYNQCKNLGLKVGFYHFLVGTSQPETQAENFYNYIKNYTNDLYPCMDIETNFEGLCDYIERFISKWKSMTDLNLAVYTYSSFINYLYPVQTLIENMPCWIANYTSDYNRVKTGFFNNIIGWQYSENDTIGRFVGDCNWFNDKALLNQIGWKQNAIGWWYVYNNSGDYYTNEWKKINDNWYAFDENGYARKGWFKDKDHRWYYLNPEDNGEIPECAMSIGWIKYKGKDLYLAKKYDEENDIFTGQCLSNITYNIDGNSYSFDKDGYLI